MSIDAVALLLIPALPAPRTEFGAEHLVEHRGDASLLHTFASFYGVPPDERALALRRLLGPALDAHHDPRGVLFFPDVCEPRGASYDAIVQEVSGAGEWSPIVAADHVPLRIASAAAGTHDALLAQMVSIMGRDAAMSLDMMARVNILALTAAGENEALADEYRQTMAQVTALLGVAFANAFDASVRREVERQLSAARR